MDSHIPHAEVQPDSSPVLIHGIPAQVMLVLPTKDVFRCTWKACYGDTGLCRQWLSLWPAILGHRTIPHPGVCIYMAPLHLNGFTHSTTCSKQHGEHHSELMEEQIQGTDKQFQFPMGHRALTTERPMILNAYRGIAASPQWFLVLA
jgi:hypothetical protein